MDQFQIVVPTQNSYKILPQLIESIKGQTWGNWKVFFVDGESNLKNVRWLKRLCSNDHRFFYLKQKAKYHGIFGAMNQALEIIDLNNWIIFWGSDDWVMSPNTFEKLSLEIQKLSNLKLDLIICKGKYYNLDKTFYKNTKFKFQQNNKILYKEEYKRHLFLGFTPPHQATLINPNLFKKYKYDDRFKITGDLDFFCRICNEEKLFILVLDLYLVSISRGGISSKKHFYRFLEVIKSYNRIFGNLFFIPFITRYLLKIFRII